MPTPRALFFEDLYDRSSFGPAGNDGAARLPAAQGNEDQNHEGLVSTLVYPFPQAPTNCMGAAP
jgi:hypothetical protein